MYRQTSIAPPSTEVDEDIRLIKKAINEEMGNLPSAGPKTSLRRFEKEEECTKGFYQNFRARHANMNIEELHIVNDWNNPEVEDTTDDIDTIKRQIYKYYEWLYQEKETSREHTEELLSHMGGMPLPQKVAQRADSKIKVDDVTAAIRATANNKSPGPDGLPGEFYRAFEQIIAQPLKDAIIESQKTNRLPPSMLEGDITLIYKKKDPKDIRNYRPITLLNVDYKILTKILADRLKDVCEALISSPQKGFVPGRQITDLTRQVYLLQDYVEAQDQEALLVMLDMEKAFDRCSWEFMMESMQAAGVGHYMIQWVNLIYNRGQPPKRRIKVNGDKTDLFELGSGVAQGCPLSPLLFLFIAEPLTKLMQEDKIIEGVTIGDYEHRISQFADDTALYLKNWEQLPRLMELVGKWEASTAMVANKDKTALIPMGALKEIPPPEGLLEMLDMGEPNTDTYEIYLGVPVASDRKRYKEFIEHKYRKIKAKIASWKPIQGLTHKGRAMIADSLVYSRLRYWAQCMHIPDNVNQWIQEDVQALIWNKEPVFDPDEDGTEVVNKRFMTNESQYSTKNRLGLGLMNWNEHIKAIKVKALLDYLDGTTGDYKKILNEWIIPNYGHAREAAVMYNIKDKSNSFRLKQGREPLPRFWKDAVDALDELKLCLVKEEDISQEAALREPIWYSHLFQVPTELCPYKEIWENRLRLRTIADMISEDGTLWTDDQIIEQIKEDVGQRAWQSTRDSILIKLPNRSKRVRATTLIENYKRILGAIPKYLIEAARGNKKETIGPRNIVESTRIASHRMDIDGTVTKYPNQSQRSGRIAEWLERHGWEPDTPLKEGGLVYPIWPRRKKRSENKKASNKALNKEIKFVKGPTLEEEMNQDNTEQETQEEEEDIMIRRWDYYALGEEQEEDGQIERVDKEKELYFRMDTPTENEGERNVELCTISPRGHLIAREVWRTLQMNLFVPLTRWGQGVMGRTQDVYPHPNQWTFENSPGRKPLDQIGVNEIYSTLMFKKRVPPNCLANWERRLNIDIPWRAIGENLSQGLGTNRDTSSWFKNIVHRALYLRGKGGQNTACSACHQENEDWIHLWQCPIWEPTWRHFIKDINTILPPIQGRERALFSPSFVYLGILDEDSTPHALPMSLALMHSILWKYIIMELFNVSNNEYYIINTNNVGRRAIRRYTTRIRAKLRRAQIALAKSTHRGDEHNNDRINRKLEPAAHIDADCEQITWHPKVLRWVALAGAEEHEGIRPTYTPEW